MLGFIIGLVCGLLLGGMVGWTICAALTIGRVRDAEQERTLAEWRGK